MKYDTQIGELKTKLTAATNVLVVLPKEVNSDKLAAALSLYLSLKQSGKSASIVSESELKVADSNLFGIGDIKAELPESAAGNLTVVMEGVVEGGKVPALEKLDWYPDGNNLNLVFHVSPGKKFEPINISHRYDTATFSMIFFVGAATLADFGNFYTQNIDKLADAFKVNIDNSQNNNLYGAVNIIDPDSASLSEVISQVIQGLGLSQDADTATNLIAGIYGATENLTVRVTADTFLTVGQEMQLGGRMPQGTSASPASGFDIRQFGKPALQQVSEPAESVNQPTNEPENTETPTPADTSDKTDQQVAKSQYEVPTGEQVTSGNPENANPAPDWLTPKIFKGGGLG